MRRKKQQRPMGKIIGLSGALATCVIGLVVAILMLPSNTPDQFGCFEAVDAPSTHVFVDASEPRWNEEQQRALWRYFNQLFDSLAFNEQLKVYTSEGDTVASIMQPRFHVCGSATSPEHLDAINAPSGNAGYLKKQKQRLYEQVFKPELDKLLALKPDSARKQQYQSPVLETIKALSRQLQPGDRLSVVSDLIQHTESFSFCRVRNDMPPFVTFEKRSIYQRRLKPQPLDGISVDVLMLQRFGYGRDEYAHCREDELQQFYEDFFTANGADALQVIRIRAGYVEAS